MIDLTNQVAVITGGSRGIGAATALMMAKAGANVLITYRVNKAAAKDILSKIDECGCKSAAVKCDVASASDCRKVIQTAMKKFKRVDILVNSAGIWEFAPLNAMTLAKWNRTLSVNLTGTFNMCCQVIPIMKKQKYGRIINVASTAGQRGEVFYSHYASSKGGVISFTKSIAIELIREGIWVNCVAPGWVNTDMISSVTKANLSKKKIMQAIPRGVIATPKEIAGPIVFLASDLSNNIVGEILNVNGGSVLCG